MSKPLVLLHGEIKTPPFSDGARKAAGFLLRRLQGGDVLAMPASRPLPSIGERCHELRVKDFQFKTIWRIVYRTDANVILIVDIFAKKPRKMPIEAVWRCKGRLRKYDQAE